MYMFMTKHTCIRTCSMCSSIQRNLKKGLLNFCDINGISVHIMLSIVHVYIHVYVHVYIYRLHYTHSAV